MRNLSLFIHQNEIIMKKLDYDIMDFFNFMSPVPFEDLLRQRILDKVRVVVQKLWKDCQVFPFGSSITGLCFPTSDLDLVVIGNTQLSAQPLVMIKNYLIHQKIAVEDSVCLLDKAKIPLLKFRDIETQINVDLCCNVNSCLTAYSITMFYLKKFPMITPLFYAVKHLLNSKRLDNPFYGGISSYPLLILFVSYFQLISKNSPNHDVGQHLINFLFYYGFEFDFVRYGISVRNGGSHIKKSRCHLPHAESPGTLYLDDPMKPFSQLTANAYEAPRIFKLFKETYQKIFKNIRNFREIFILKNESSTKDMGNLLNEIILIPESIKLYRKKNFLMCQKIILSNIKTIESSGVSELHNSNGNKNSSLYDLNKLIWPSLKDKLDR